MNQDEDVKLTIVHDNELLPSIKKLRDYIVERYNINHLIVEKEDEQSPDYEDLKNDQK